MNILRSKNGQMRVIESILASFIVIFAISFVNTFAVTPRSSTYEVDDLEKLGFNMLHDLDEQRLLSNFVYNQLTWSTNFTIALRVSLPSDVYFDLKIYDLNQNILNSDVPIRYGDAGLFTSSASVASITYSLVGYSKFDSTAGSQFMYEPRTLILLLVRE